MKKFVIVLFSLSLFISLNAQEFMTNREVYDFGIGDIFHYFFERPEGSYFNEKDITRVNILDKYYSIEQDTIFYFEHYDKLESYDFDQNGVRTYFYSENNKTYAYTELDSSINPGWDYYSIENSPALCDCLVNSFTKGGNQGGDSYHIKFGKGLGTTYNGYSAYHGSYSSELQYYKKGEVDCGTPLSWPAVLTIGKVFDFEIGDEFQTKSVNINPAIIDRISIVDKFYSVALDTVFYVRFHNSYNIETDPISPDFTLTFWTKTDTVFYTSLNSLIPKIDIRIFRFQSYNSVDYCGSLVNGNDFGNYKIEYGEGLGLVSSDSVQLFYFKKGENECGTADKTTLGINDFNQNKALFSVFPNPARSSINVFNNSQQSFRCNIISSVGQLVITTKLSPGSNKININSLIGGLYYVQLIRGDKISIIKIVVE